MFRSVDPIMMVREFLASLGMSDDVVFGVSSVILVLAVALLAWLSKVFMKLVLEKFFTLIVRRSKSVYDDRFLETRMFGRLAMIIPRMVVYYLATWMLRENPGWLTFIHMTAALYIVTYSTLTLTAFIEGWHSIYNMQPTSSGRSIKPYIQIVKVFIGFIGVLVIIAILFKISIGAVITGLGVATAVLALIFKDTLLGLVASVQLASNDMVKLGDWITIPGRNVDGTVIDISLYTVKVENFDKTIHTVPTYALISESFQNWKGMSDSGVRRIRREIRIDVRSITLLTPDMLESVAGKPMMEKWLNDNSIEIEALRQGEATSLTNLGAYRAYMVGYLLKHSHIDAKRPVMVRDMPPADSGLPVEIYCFSMINSWLPFERVQSEVLEYAYAVVEQFGLKLFQNPTGSDIEALKKETK